MNNHFVEVAEISIDPETHAIGLRFGFGGDTFVLPPAAAESLGRGLVDAATYRPPAVSPSHARWT